MIIDLNQESGNTIEKKYDFCVCGAGVAGITVALELAKTGKSIALLEAGGLEVDKLSQDTTAGDNIGLPYWGIEACRLRYLGGSSNHWAGRCMQLQPIDFYERDYIELPGWPIRKKELDVYLKRALEIMDVNKGGLVKKIYPELKDSTLRTVGLAMSLPTRFGKKYFNELKTSKNIDLYLNANLTNIILNEALNHVAHIRIQNYKGNVFLFSGNQYINAMGALENARLLLNSDSQITGGIGNQSGFVGRCFMEHLNINLGRFILNSEVSLNNDSKFELFPTCEFALKKKIGTSVLAFQSNSAPKIYGRLKEFKKKLRNSVCNSESLTDITRKLIDFDCPGDGIISTLCEQTPNPNSRLKLTNKRDNIGLRTISLNWQITDFDRYTIRTLAKETAKEFARLDLGRIQLPNFIFDDHMDIDVGGHCHQMGTTRMAKSSKYGVVDSNCRVFGVDNLYLAGSSVFSTGGGVNPTLSIVQLSLRLADYVKNIY